MARDLLATEYGDLVIDSSTHDLATVDGLEEVAQRIRATLLIRYGEMPNLDPDQGSDYSNFLGKNFNEKLASADMSTAIQEKVPEVQTVNIIAFKKKPKRGLHVYFNATIKVDDKSEELKGGLDLNG
ncbi:hypothetical protein [Lactobacillus helveticus]|uniref:hypothetical protein n=1 Tax=Lactobacillus helveticus TaxID=1587 RepID=UPI00062AA62B|nr:hypothetical protein [Lactobacillus helveticus]AKG66656.1 hypothetical protein TU99_04890 [Lactobacillus helveticus]